MYAIFFNTTGVKALIVPLEPGKTINSTWYTESCYLQLTKRLIYSVLAQDEEELICIMIVSSLTSKLTRQFIEESGLHILPHPPYSPDLAQCDFWLFPRIKKHLKGRNFSCNSEVEEALRNIISDIEENEFKDAIQAWFTRLNKCIHAKGCYFEQV